jgi:hypothetical protein
MIRPLLLVAGLLLATLAPAAQPTAPSMPPQVECIAAIPQQLAEPAVWATPLPGTPSAELLAAPVTPAPAQVMARPVGLAPAGVTIEIPITTGSDDAGPNPASAWPSLGGCEYRTSWNEIYFGLCIGGPYVVSGFRFTNVPVPAGAHIVEAHIRFTLDSYQGEEITVRFYGEASGNAQTFSDTDRPANRPVNTQAYGEWHVPASEVWTLGDQRDSPDLTAVIQAIVDRPDWRPGNALAIIAQSIPPSSGYWHHRRVIGHERAYWFPGTQYAARLVISYEIVQPTATPTATSTATPTATATATPSRTPPPVISDIAGTVWLDVDGDAARDAGEPGIAGVQVCAEPLGHPATRCATSGPDGSYQIDLDMAGTYLVGPSAAPAGMRLTTKGFRLPVVVREGQQVRNVDFGYR